MPPKQNRGKEHKKKEEEKPKPEKMLPDISDKKVRKPDVSRQNMGAVLPESKCSTVKVKRRKTIVVDKQKRVGELSKLCSELKKGKGDIKEKKKKIRSKKKKKIKNNGAILLDKCYDDNTNALNGSTEIKMVKRSSEVGSAAHMQIREKKMKKTLAKDVSQNKDVFSMTIRKPKDNMKQQKPNKIDTIGGRYIKKLSTASDRIGTLDLSDLERSVSSISKSRPTQLNKQRKKKAKTKTKNRKMKNLPSTQIDGESEDLGTPPTPTSSLNDTQSVRPISVQSKRNLFEGVFGQRTEGMLPPYASPGKEGSVAKSHILATPKTLKRGFVALNLVSPLVSKSSNSRGQKPPKRIMDGSQHDKNRAQGYIDSAIALLSDRSRKKEVRTLVHEINQAGGFPMTRRLSLRDNELVGQMTMVIRNDPRIKSIEVCPTLFGTISSTLLEQFVRALRINLHLRSLTFSGVELGNDFLFSLASAMESNFVLEEIDLSKNLFTNAGLAEFCEVVASSNDTCKILNLENQTTPISKASEEDVLEAFQQNRAMQEVKLDFQSEEAAQQLAEIINRNKIDPPLKTSNDDKLLNVLRYEAERAEELLEEQNEGDSVLDITENDWDHLYELSIQFDKHKLKNHIQATSEDFVPSTRRRNGDSMTKEEKKNFLFGEFRKNLGESISCFKADGSFLTSEFISKYFEEDDQNSALTFDFHGQWKLFRRFPAHDPARQLIVTKFVDAIVSHPRADEITSINMANTGCGDDFLVGLASRCLRDESLLPSLLALNFETNFINVYGISALAKVIASSTSLKFLQVVRLENQKFLLKSKAELALARAMRVNFSIVVMSLRIRNLMERQQISKYVLRNVELIRQARQRHFKVTGQQRERNVVEKFFDKIAENDCSIDEVDLVGNKRFLTLISEEKIKAANSFATNTNVKNLNLNSCGIDDEFAIALAFALKRNKGIFRVSLEGNAISGIGITALFEALAENSSIEEMRLHKQSKTMNTSEEQMLADILLPNITLTRLGLDLRTTMAQVQLDKKMNLNRNTQLKLRAEAKGETFHPIEVFPGLKF
jgi:hypothetical protein